MQRPTILVVDDEAAQREVVAYNLESSGYKVICADNGEDALLITYEEQPDLIVLDWMMPKLSGIEVCRQLRVKKETKNIPIILLSARSEDIDKVRGLDIVIVIKALSKEHSFALLEKMNFPFIKKGDN